ncbi:MAG: insulinase family protein [Melioribacteraceae bacterium]|nr:insulinase family protein [Melioribacteraceae bacterium]
MGFSLNGFRITKLSNGIHVLSENISYVKSFSLGFWFDTGSKNESVKNNGISHFIEHMLFKGTSRRSAAKLSDEIESLGGYLNAFTSKEHTCYYGRGLSQYIGKTFEVISDMVLNSQFKAKDIRNEQGVIIDELYDINDSPEELIFDKFESNIYSGNFLQHPIIGTEENINSFDKSMILEYIEKNYTNKNLYIAASGLVNHDQIVNLADKYFGRRKTGESHKTKSLRLRKSNDLVVNKEVQQIHAIIGKPVDGYNSKKRVAINILSHILGEGSSSRLFQTLREKNGITYQINTFLNSFYNVSSFGIYFSTNPRNFNKAMNLVYAELEKFKKRPISKKEFSRARAYVKGNIILGMENTTNRMMRMAQSFIYFNRIKTLEETVAEIDKLDQAELEQLAVEIFNPDSFVRTIISPEDLQTHR